MTHSRSHSMRPVNIVTAHAYFSLSRAAYETTLQQHEGKRISRTNSNIITFRIRL